MIRKPHLEYCNTWPQQDGLGKVQHWHVPPYTNSICGAPITGYLGQYRNTKGHQHNARRNYEASLRFLRTVKSTKLRCYFWTWEEVTLFVHLHWEWSSQRPSRGAIAINMWKEKSELTIALGHGVNKRAPLSRDFGESPHSELVEGATVQRLDVLGGLVAIVCVHPGVQAALADGLVLYDVLHNASVGIFGRQPLDLDGWHGQRQGLDIAWGRRTWNGWKFSQSWKVWLV